MVSKASLYGGEAGLLAPSACPFKMVWFLYQSQAACGVHAAVAVASPPGEPGLPAPWAPGISNCPSHTHTPTTQTDCVLSPPPRNQHTLIHVHEFFLFFCFVLLNPSPITQLLYELCHFNCSFKELYFMKNICRNVT